MDQNGYRILRDCSLFSPIVLEGKVSKQEFLKLFKKSFVQAEKIHLSSIEGSFELASRHLLQSYYSSQSVGNIRKFKRNVI
jgi:hypothetical protein